MCVCSVMSDSLRPYGLVAHQAPLSMGLSRQDSNREIDRSPQTDNHL